MPAPPSSTASLLTDRIGGITRLTLNRPDKRNALSEEMLGLLETAIGALSADSETRVVVISGNGPAFCAGHDLTEMTGRAETQYHDLFESCTRVMLGLRRLPQPVIARVQGIATAAGCQLVAACDLAVAAREATFATPGVKIGLFCSTPMVPLVRAIPSKAALEMLLTGTPISADRAYELGLVNTVVPLSSLDDTVMSLAQKLMASSPLVLQLGKRAFYELKNLPEEEAYRGAISVMTDNALKHDAQEGITAFLEKRIPRWSSR